MAGDLVSRGRGSSESAEEHQGNLRELLVANRRGGFIAGAGSADSLDSLINEAENKLRI